MNNAPRYKLPYYFIIELNKNLCIKKDILSTLAYFDMFNYPLKKREIYNFMGHSHEWHLFNHELNDLLIESSIYKTGNFYSIHNNQALAERRCKGNDKATTMLVKAERGAALIAGFPFITGVAVSGSLSKKFASDDADIDFFIITAPNRLWLARTFLHVFKKITFLFNMQDFFCMNYFIDESEPIILEKNIYTATEVVTIMPLRGQAIFEKFYTANNWTKKYLPNYPIYMAEAKDITKNWITRLTEKILNNQAGNLADNFLMWLTAKSWDAKTARKKKNSKGLLMSMHTGKHFSKPNPEGFQKKLLHRYENSLATILKKYTHDAGVKNGLL